MVGRPRGFDLDEVVARTVPVFRRRGFNGASLADLGKAMGLAPGSIYKAFADKRAIFLAAFDRYVTDRGDALRAAIERAPDGLGRLEAFLRHYLASATGAEGRMGCLVVNAATELAAEDAGMEELVSGALARNETVLAGLIDAGRADGSIRPDLDVAATARMLLCLAQGFRILGKTGRVADDLDPVVRQMLRLVAAWRGT